VLHFGTFGVRAATAMVARASSRWRGIRQSERGTWAGGPKRFNSYIGCRLDLLLSAGVCLALGRGTIMKNRKIVLVPLATALASLSGAANATTPANQSAEPTNGPADTQLNATKIQPNTIFKAGEDLLGLLVTTAANGTVVAQHASHYSHSSHASHASHASSRY
jgi:hypothetical protein